MACVTQWFICFQIINCCAYIINENCSIFNKWVIKEDIVHTIRFMYNKQEFEAVNPVWKVI